MAKKKTSKKEKLNIEFEKLKLDVTVLTSTIKERGEGWKGGIGSYGIFAGIDKPTAKLIFNTVQGLATELGLKSDWAKRKLKSKIKPSTAEDSDGLVMYLPNNKEKPKLRLDGDFEKGHKCQQELGRGEEVTVAVQFAIYEADGDSEYTVDGYQLSIKLQAVDATSEQLSTYGDSDGGYDNFFGESPKSPFKDSDDDDEDEEEEEAPKPKKKKKKKVVVVEEEDEDEDEDEEEEAPKAKKPKKVKTKEVSSESILDDVWG